MSEKETTPADKAAAALTLEAYGLLEAEYTKLAAALATAKEL
jgi:hypothetical protein